MSFGTSAHSSTFSKPVIEWKHLASATVLVLLLATTSGHASPISIGVSSHHHNESVTSDWGTNRVAGGGASSYFTNQQPQPDTFGVVALADSAAYHISTSIWHLGSSVTGGNEWSWMTGFEVYGEPGTPAYIRGNVTTQWYNALAVWAVGESKASVGYTINFAFRELVYDMFEGPGLLPPIRIPRLQWIDAGQITRNHRETRTNLGVEENEHWYQNDTFYADGLIVGDPVFGTLFLRGSFGTQASTDLASMSPGNLYASSVAQMRLTGQVFAHSQPGPQPTPVPAPSTFALLALGLLGLRICGAQLRAA